MTYFAKSLYVASCLAATGALTTGPAPAQPLEVPIEPYCDQAVTEAACSGVATVMGLDPNGDGFLSVRSGPGSNYREIGRVYNGDRVGTFTAQGNWYGISFGPEERLGWAHGNWLGDHIP